jgi:hypothetical protein
MDTPTLDAVAQRLDRLERENRWWKRLCCLGALLVLLVWSLSACSQMDEIRTKRVVVQDASGRDRVRIAVEDPRPLIEVLASNGKPIASIGGAKDSDGDEIGHLRLATGNEIAFVNLSPQMFSIVGEGNKSILLSRTDLRFRDGPSYASYAAKGAFVNDGKSLYAAYGPTGQLLMDAARLR